MSSNNQSVIHNNEITTNGGEGLFVNSSSSTRDNNNHNDYEACKKIFSYCYEDNEEKNKERLTLKSPNGCKIYF